MPIDGRARVLGMEFGVGGLLLRYFFLKENHNHTQNQRVHGIVNVIGSILILVYKQRLNDSS